MEKWTATGNDVGIYIYASPGSRILNSTLSGNDNGIYLYYSQGSSLSNNYIGTSSDTGIEVYRSNNTTLYENTLYNNTINGIYMESSNESRIYRNNLTANKNGVYAVESWHINITDNFADASGNLGIKSRGGYVLIENNTIYGGADGIEVEISEFTQVRNNTIINNTATGISVDTGSKNCTVENNHIETQSSSFSGIYINGYNNTIQFNEVEGYEDGILLSTGNGNLIRNNSLLKCVNGLYLNYATGNVLKENKVENSSEDGIILGYSQNNELTGNKIINSGKHIVNFYGNASHCTNTLINNTDSSGREIALYYSAVNLSDKTLAQLVLCNASHSTINNLTVEDTPTGILMFATDFSSFSNIKIFSTHTGVESYYSDNNTFENSEITGNNYCFYMKKDSSNILRGMKVHSCNYGIYINESWSNHIYNNIFNTTSGKPGIEAGTNYWNTSKQAGVNIIGGSYLGGNYWAKPDGSGYSENCADADSDGICDSPYNLTADWKNVDYLPLTAVVDTTPPALAFVYPTPSDNTTSNLSYLFINITSSENLHSAVLEWNGTNISMSGSGKNWYKNITNLSDGVYYYRVYGGDFAGNWNSTDLRKIAISLPVDKTPPAITLISPASRIYTSKTISLKVYADEQISAWWYSLNNGVNTSFTPNTTITASEGANHLIVYASDTSGNVNKTEVYFTVDTTPPEITIISPENKTYGRNSVEINVSATDINGIDSVIAEVMTTPVNITLTQNGSYYTGSVSNLSDGQHYMRIYASDTSGNINSTQLVYFSIDTIPPHITIYSPQNRTYNISSLSLNLSSSENISTWWYSLDNGANVSFIPNTTLSNLSIGMHEIKVYASDTWGNTDFTVVVFTVNTTVYSDTTKPSMSFVSPTPVNNSVQNSRLIYVNITADEPLDSTWLEIWNSTFSGNYTLNGSGKSWYINFTNLQQGTYYYRVWGNDTSNNTNSTEIRTLTIDITSPSITLLSPLNTAHFDSSGGVNISILVGENLSRAWAEVSGIVVNLTGPGNFWQANISLSQGKYTLRVHATDLAGNTNTSSPVTFYVVKHTQSNLTSIQGNNTMVIINTTDVAIEVTASSNTTLGLKASVSGFSLGAIVLNRTTTLGEVDRGIKYVEITNTTPVQNISRVRIEIHFNSSEITGIDANTVSIFYWNGTAWINTSRYVNRTIPDDKGGLRVYEAGRYYNSTTGTGYVYAVINHTSVFGIGGNIAVSPTSPALAGGGSYTPEAVLLANSIDLSLAEELIKIMRERGIKLYITDAHNFTQYSRKNYIIILGGHRAYEGIGEIVSKITTEQEKEEILKGSLFSVKKSVFRTGGVVYIFAGKDREITRRVWKENIQKVATTIRYNWN